MYLVERQAPESIQPLATGFKARFNVTIDVECRAFSLSLAGAVAACDALIKLAEDALLEFNDEWSSDFDSEDAFEFAFQVAEEWEAQEVPA